MASHKPHDKPEPRKWWSGYVVAILLQILIAIVLLQVRRAFPVGEYPIVFVIPIMFISYLFGTGPGIFAFLWGLLLFFYLFIHPEDRMIPSGLTERGWASLAAYLLGAGTVAFATLIIRRGTIRTRDLLSEVQESEREITGIVDSITDAFYALDKDMRFTYMNSEAEHWLGKPKAELIGQSVWDNPGLGGTSNMRAALERAFAEHAVVEIEEYFHAIDTWMEVRAYPADGGLTINLHNITARKQAENAMRRYQLLTERARDVVLFVSNDGNIMEANDAAVSEYGYSREELLQKTVRDLRTADTRDTVDGQLQAAAEHGVLFEAKHQRKDGTIFPVEVSSSGVDLEGQRILLSVVRDITERVRLREGLQQQVQQLQRALLPENPKIGNGYEVAAFYLPGTEDTEIGGDFYDVFETEDGRAAVAIGDVSGKGIQAAALAAAARSTIRAFAYDTSSPGNALTHSNSVLYVNHMGSESFVTASAAVIDMASGKVCYASAAHPPAVIHRRETGDVEFTAFGQIPFGISDTEQYKEHECVLQPGDSIVFYTDGISEARRGGEMFGMEGIEKTIKACTQFQPNDIIKALLEAASDFADGHLTDDIAVVAITRLYHEDTLHQLEDSIG